MIRFLLPGSAVLLFFVSCTMVLSTNTPGKPQSSLPQEWLGTYQVFDPSPLPSKRDSANEKKTYAVIESTRVTWKTNDEVRILTLGDSLNYSEIYGQSRYISLLLPQGLYAVVKVVKNADTLELYSLCSDNEEIKKSDLSKYFDKVEKQKSEGDEYYRVTIVDKKLDAYFKSSVPSKAITRLVKVSQ